MAVVGLQREPTTTSLSTCASSNVAEYPTGLVVRNTFLDFKIQRPESLEGFLDERHVRSAPGSKLEDMCGDQVPTVCQVPKTNEFLQTNEVLQHNHVAANTGLRSTLQLAELIAEPQLGSPGLPTIGSKNHLTGGCKPCAFFWKEPGCQNGINCPFCHLCDAGEKKRRGKEKKEKTQSLRTGTAGLRKTVYDQVMRLI